MVCSNLDSAGEVRSMEGGQDGCKNSAREDKGREIEILSPEGKILKMNVEHNTTVRTVKIDCELLCGIPSHLQIIQHQGKELSDTATATDLELTESCPLKLTVPQWWLKFVATCFKGQTLQVRKRIFIKMHQVSREERTFTAAFIAATKGNHNLMFAAFAGRKFNVHSRAELSGRTLLHAAISGGSTSCVANILMNGGNALLDTADNSGETPVAMAKKLHGEGGEIVQFLNVYLELHQREKKNSVCSNLYWDNLGRNNYCDISGNRIENSEETSLKPGEAKDDLGDRLDVCADDQSVEHKRATCTETNDSINDSVFVNDTNVKRHDANSPLVNTGKCCEPRNGTTNGSLEFKCSDTRTGQTLDTENCSNHQSIARNGEKNSETFNNRDLFTQTEATPSVITTEVNLRDQTEGEDVTNLSMVSAMSGESDAGRSPKLPRRAQIRKQAFLDQRRKRSTTDRPNIGQLIIPDKSYYREQQKNEDRPKRESPFTASDVLDVWQHQDNTNVSMPSDRESDASIGQPIIPDKSYYREQQKNEDPPKRESPFTASDVLDVWQHQDNTNVSMPSDRESDATTHSPKPPRRALLRKQAFLDRRRSATERPNVDQLITKESSRNSVQTGQESCEKEKEYQDITNVTMKSVVSVDEGEGSHSPKLPRRAHLRKQEFLEQRRKRSTAERPNIDQLITLNNTEGDEKEGHAGNKDSCQKEKPSVSENDVPPHREDVCSSIRVSSDKEPLIQSCTEDSEKSKSLSPLPPASKNQSKFPGRRFRRYLQSSPSLEAKAHVDAGSQGSWSSLSGDESEASDRERNVVQETVAPINVPRNQRRRLPSLPLPDKRLNLPLIKVEDSGGAETHSHVMVASHVNGAGRVTRERSFTVADTTSSPFIAPHRPDQPPNRSRSGSTCSEDSLSSGEILLVRSRAHSEGENALHNKTVVPNLRPSKSCPVRHRRKSVPSSPFNHMARTRRYSVQVDELDGKGYQMTPQLRAKLTLRGQPRERMPWNEWRVAKRNAFVSGDSDNENSEGEDLGREERTVPTEAFDFVWKEKSRRPQTGRPSRISFVKWLENKEAITRVRPESARVDSESGGQAIDQERQLQASEKYQEWLRKKDEEALEQEERLRREGRRKFQTAHKRN